MYGIVFLIEADSGYCLDFETMSKRCELCEGKERTLTSVQFQKWVKRKDSIVQEKNLFFSIKHIKQHVRKIGMVVLGQWKKKVQRKSSKDLFKRV